MRRYRDADAEVRKVKFGIKKNKFVGSLVGIDVSVITEGIVYIVADSLYSYDYIGKSAYYVPLSTSGPI